MSPSYNFPGVGSDVQARGKLGVMARKKMSMGGKAKASV